MVSTVQLAAVEQAVQQSTPAQDTTLMPAIQSILASYGLTLPATADATTGLLSNASKATRRCELVVHATTRRPVRAVERAADGVADRGHRDRLVDEHQSDRQQRVDRHADAAVAVEHGWPAHHRHHRSGRGRELGEFERYSAQQPHGRHRNPCGDGRQVGDLGVRWHQLQRHSR
jgi:hypothetical protein